MGRRIRPICRNFKRSLLLVPKLHQFLSTLSYSSLAMLCYPINPLSASANRWFNEDTAAHLVEIARYVMQQLLAAIGPPPQNYLASVKTRMSKGLLMGGS